MRVAWYKVLERRFPGYAATTVCQKVALDQFCFAPGFVFILISLISFSNGMNTFQVSEKLKSSYTDIILNNWKASRSLSRLKAVLTMSLPIHNHPSLLQVWPCVQLCNFYLVPSHLRMTTVQFVALLWNVYISWKTNVNKANVNKLDTI